MPRRAKYLIAALFLVLLGIPVVYFTITWTAPKNPLRFSIEEVMGMENHNVRDGWVLARFRVENTTDVPVCLMRAEAHTPRSSNVYCEIKHSDSLRSGWYVIPPRSSIECIGDLNIYRVRMKKFKDGTMMQYTWVSKTQAATMRVSCWLKENSPERLRSRVPWVTLQTDKTTLQPPPHIP